MMVGTFGESSDIAKLVSDYSISMNQGWLDLFMDCMNDDDVRDCFSLGCASFKAQVGDYFETGFGASRPERTVGNSRSRKNQNEEDSLWEDLDEIDPREVKAFCKKVRPLTMHEDPSPVKARSTIAILGNIYDYSVKIGRDVVDSALDTGSCISLLTRYGVNSKKRVMKKTLDTYTYNLWLFCAGHVDQKPSSNEAKRSLFCVASRKFESYGLNVYSLQDYVSPKGKSILKELGMEVEDIAAMIGDEDIDTSCGKDEL